MIHSPAQRRSVAGGRRDMTPLAALLDYCTVSTVPTGTEALVTRPAIPDRTAHGRAPETCFLFLSHAPCAIRSRWRIKLHHVPSPLLAPSRKRNRDRTAGPALRHSGGGDEAVSPGVPIGVIIIPYSYRRPHSGGSSGYSIVVHRDCKATAAAAAAAPTSYYLLTCL